MGRSWLLSSLLHTALAAVLWFGLPSWGRPLPAIGDAIVVELVSDAAEDTGPPEPEVAALAPEPERQAARPEPRPPAREPEPQPEPPPEPVAAPAPEPPPPPEPEPAPEPEPPPEAVVEPEPEQRAALEPEPPPERVTPRPEPRLEAPPKPQVQPKPQRKPAPPQAVAKPEPAPPPEPEPAPPEPSQQDEFAALLRSVEEMDRRREGEVATEGTGRSRDGAGRARTELGEARLSIGEIDALRRQIGRCWTLPVGIDGIEDMMVQLRIQVRPDRTVQGVAIQDQARLGRDARFRAVAESARRAVDKCSPLNLPPDKYAVWREIDMKFYPEDAISG